MLSHCSSGGTAPSIIIPFFFHPFDQRILHQLLKLINSFRHRYILHPLRRGIYRQDAGDQDQANDHRHRYQRETPSPAKMGNNDFFINNVVKQQSQSRSRYNAPDCVGNCLCGDHFGNAPRSCPRPAWRRIVSALLIRSWRYCS